MSLPGKTYVLFFGVPLRDIQCLLQYTSEQMRITCAHTPSQCKETDTQLSYWGRHVFTAGFCYSVPDIPTVYQISADSTIVILVLLPPWVETSEPSSILFD